MQSHYRMELVAELPQEFEKLSANAVDASEGFKVGLHHF